MGLNQSVRLNIMSCTGIRPRKNMVFEHFPFEYLKAKHNVRNGYGCATEQLRTSVLRKNQKNA